MDGSCQKFKFLFTQMIKLQRAQRFAQCTLRFMSGLVKNLKEKKSIQQYLNPAPGNDTRDLKPVQ